MADTSTLRPEWQLVLGLLPSFNSILIALASAAIGIGGTLATQKLAAPKVGAAPSALEVQVGQLAASVEALRAEMDQRLPAAKPGVKAKGVVK